MQDVHTNRTDISTPIPLSPYDCPANRHTILPKSKGKHMVTMSSAHLAVPSRFNAEQPPNSKLSREDLLEILHFVFQRLLPAHGYSIREPQVELTEHILDCICRRRVSLSEAEVGTGKTLAYLVAAILAKRGRVNDFWYRDPGQSYIHSANLPVVISTSSIALQNALIRDYIPDLSRILIAGGVIHVPITSALRKGKEHYLCEHRLHTYIADADAATKEILSPLLNKDAPIDLADVENLTSYMKRRIGVSGQCGKRCPRWEKCRYLRHMKIVQSSQHDFQICNHNYLLADILRQQEGNTPLIPHYQAVIIDEAHKFLQSARQMYGVELLCGQIPQAANDIRTLHFRKGENSDNLFRNAKKLVGQGKRLFASLIESIPIGAQGDADRFPIIMDSGITQHLCNIHRICDDLTSSLNMLQVLSRYKGVRNQALWEIFRIREAAAFFEQHRDLVCWQENPGEGKIALYGIPKNLDELLYHDFWKKGIPAVLTSGTLSANRDFSHIRRTLGLDKLPLTRVMEITKPSPFRYRDNALLFISSSVPFPDSKDRAYLSAVANEVEKLVATANGHTAVLFTSYNVMGLVYAALHQRNLPYPIYRMNRGDTAAVENFRRSKNGVLFASGALWEGIDIPGDALSMLIIVKLPFPVPDPISEYEQTLYPDMTAYKSKVIVPEMLMKLKQGFGRLIRTETDTGIVALLDSRVRPGSSYRESVLKALPDCRVTDEISDVAAFLQTKKSPAYFD